MDRCEIAFNCRKEGHNCAQSVAVPFADLLGMAPEALAAAMSGFGGGIGGCHEEVCGAVSGGVYVLSMLFADQEDRAGHETVYPRAMEFRRRFSEFFGDTRCGALRDTQQVAEKRASAAVRLDVTAPCDILVVTAVEILEQMLSAENGVEKEGR